jgi:beta-lactamase class A
MARTRRSFLSGLAGAAGVAALAAVTDETAYSWQKIGLADDIIAAFQTLPGKKALLILAPAAGAASELRVTLNADSALFCASAFKGFVLAEFLRMVDAGEATLTELLPVNDSIWSLGSAVLAPLPGTVTGEVNARTALDAMISRSDNTATDMMLKRVGPDGVRSFIASIGLHNTRIPNSTRQFFGYVLGDPQWQTITFQQSLDFLEADPFPPKPILNDVQTMAASPSDFVSFYSRALQGKFFSNPGTLTTFRAILSESEAIPRVMPLGVNAFLKGGSIDFNGQHALSLAGGMFVPGQRWVYFGMIINWTDVEGGTVEQEGPQFASTTKQIFTSLRDALASEPC